MTSEEQAHKSEIFYMDGVSLTRSGTREILPQLLLQAAQLMCACHSYLVSKNAPVFIILRSLSNNDDNGSENVGKKMNLHSFKVDRVYSDPLNMSNAGDLSWSWILKDFTQVQKEEGKFVIVCPRPP